MDKMTYPRGLIRYTTARALEGGTVRVLRPRIVIYAGVLGLLLALFAYRVLHRPAVGLDVLHDRNALYRETQGQIENVYTLRIINKREAARKFALRVEGESKFLILTDRPDIVVAAGAVFDLPVRLRTASALTKSVETVRFVLTALDDPNITATTEAKFLSPLP